MAGLQYRTTSGSVNPSPAVDTVCDETYYLTAKSNDAVVLNGDGKIIAAPAGAAYIYGVSAGREIAVEKATVHHVKVRTSREVRYEVTVASGTPKVDGKYNLTADYSLNASAAGTAVKVVEMSEGKVYVILLPAVNGGA